MNGKYLSQEVILELLNNLKARDEQLSKCLQELNTTVKDLSKSLSEVQQEMVRVKAVKNFLTSKMFWVCVVGLIALVSDNLHIIDLIKLLGGM